MNMHSQAVIYRWYEDLLINLDIKWTKIKQEHMYDRDDRLTAYYVCQLGFSKKKKIIM